MLQFSISQETIDSVNVIYVKGELDLYTCPQLEEALATSKTVDSDLLLDLSETQYIDSTGLGAIAHHAYGLGQTQRFLSLVCQNPQIIKLFEVSGLTKKNINIYEDCKTAFEHIGQQQS